MDVFCPDIKNAALKQRKTEAANKAMEKNAPCSDVRLQTSA